MSRTISVQPFITTLFTWLLLPITTALLPALLLSMVIWVVAGCATGVGAGLTGAGLMGVALIGAGLTGAGFTGHGHLFVREASQLSRRSFTTFKESVNLRFSFNKLSICVVLFFTTGCVCSSFDEFAVLLQLASIITTTATGNARRIRIHLLDGCVVILFFLCSGFDVLCIDKMRNFVKLKVVFCVCRYRVFLV